MSLAKAASSTQDLMDQRLPPPFFDPLAVRDSLEALWRRHGESRPEMRAELLALLKGLVSNAQAAAETGLEADGKGRRCAQALSLFQDELIRLIYDFITARIYVVENPTESERMSILATGGYGRGLMAPHSDVDLLFLLPYKQTPWGESIAEYMLYLMWDLGFKVGHATRSIDQTIRFAKTDMTTRTALLDARLMFGNVPPYRGRPQKLFDGIVIASIVFFHEPDELDGVIDADFKQGPTGVVDLIAIRDPFDRPDWIPDR
jgi:[protein-PII] uridylyltransferase